MSSEEQKDAERQHRELLDFARSTTDDLYDLLSLPSPPETFPPSDLRRAWRRAALRLHPDKNPGKENEFESARRAFEVLSDEAARAVYDGRRRAEAERREREQQLDGRKRHLVQQLHEGEAAARRKREQSGTERARQDTAESARRKQTRDAAASMQAAREDLKRRQREEEDEAEATARAKERREKRKETSRQAVSQVDEIDCTIRVSWQKDETNPIVNTLDKERLTTLFRRFGGIANVLVFTEKKPRAGSKDLAGGSRAKSASAAIIFTCIRAAHAATLHGATLKKLQGVEPEWAIFSSIEWWVEDTMVWLEPLLTSNASVETLPRDRLAGRPNDFELMVMRRNQQRHQEDADDAANESADRTVPQVRVRQDGTMVYSFTPVWIRGMPPEQATAGEISQQV